jgi:hypothetical protein
MLPLVSTRAGEVISIEWPRYQHQRALAYGECHQIAGAQFLQPEISAFLVKVPRYCSSRTAMRLYCKPVKLKDMDLHRSTTFRVSRSHSTARRKESCKELRRSLGHFRRGRPGSSCVNKERFRLDVSGAKPSPHLKQTENLKYDHSSFYGNSEIIGNLRCANRSMETQSRAR